jgi:dsRNA-specific ribonuclease
MFMGPFDQSVSWSSKGLVGARRFLDRAFDCVEKAVSANGEVDQKNLNFALNLLHKTIKKVGSDIEEFKFNTAIAQLMIFVNEILIELPFIITEGSYLDPKSKLQELVQEKQGVTPTYGVISESGPDHDKVFVVAAFINDKEIGRGNGPSKQEAEIAAAENSLQENQF